MKKAKGEKSPASAIDEVGFYGVKFHSAPPGDFFVWLQNVEQDPTFNSVFDAILFENTFGFRPERQGKWCAWLFAEHLYRSCDGWGLAMYAIGLLKELDATRSDITPKAIELVECVILGEKIDAALVKLTKDLKKKDRLAPGTPEQEMMRILEIVRKISLWMGMLKSDKSTPEQINTSRAALCDGLIKVSIELAADVSGNDPQRMRHYLVSRITPILMEATEHPANGGLRGLIDSLAEQAFNDVARELKDPRNYEDYDLADYEQFALQTGISLATMKGLPRLANRIGKASEEKFKDWYAPDREQPLNRRGFS